MKRTVYLERVPWADSPSYVYFYISTEKNATYLIDTPLTLDLLRSMGEVSLASGYYRLSREDWEANNG